MRKIGLLVILLLSLTMVVSAQDAPTPAPTDCGGEFDLPIWQVQDGKCNFAQAVTITVNVRYPDELNQYAFAKQAMLDYLSAAQTEFWTTMGGGYFGPEGAGMALDIDYEEITFSPSVVTVLFKGYSNTGGAHPNPSLATFTFDLANEKVLTLDDIFTDVPGALKQIFPVVKDTVMKNLPDYTDEDWITTGSGENPDNYAFFSLTPDAITFYFPPYQVAPYVAGTQEITIPLADLKDVLQPAFAPQ